MGRTKFEAAHRKIVDDISFHFEVGQRYRTLRAIAAEFNVSLQTAQYAVSSLCDQGYLRSEEKRGLFVVKKNNRVDLNGRTFLVTSSNFDPRFTEAFVAGIREVAGQCGVGVTVVQDEQKDANTIQHGEHWIEQYREHDASGLIALAYRNVELAFYHALNAGCVLIADVAFPNLPMLPAVQTDNHRHSLEAARSFAKGGKREMIVAGYWKEGNVRHATFEAEFKRLVPDGTVKYLYLGDETSPADLYMFFRRFSSRKGIFTTDYAANHTVAAYLTSYDIAPKGNFLVFDSETEVFLHPGLEPVDAAAPGLNVLGRRLAQRLIDRVATREWSQPLQELI